MIPPSLEALLEDARQHNVQLDDLLETLKRNGWSPEIIKEARNKYESFPHSPIAVTPTSTNNTSTLPSDNSNVVLTIFSLIIMLIFLTFAATSYLIAYEKIAINNDLITSIVDKMVFSIPLVPKTPKYILYSAFIANKTAVRGNVEFSFTSRSADFKSLTGSDTIAGNLIGYYNITDSQNPYFDFSVKVANDLDMLVRKTDTKNIYFKINELPPSLGTTLHLDTTALKPVFDNWIVVDTSSSPSNTAPADTPISNADTASTNVQKITKITADLFLPHVTVTNEKYDGSPAYRLELTLTPELISQYTDKLREAFPNATIAPTNDFNNAHIELWLNQQNYHFQKLTLDFNAKPEINTTDSTLNYLPTTINSDIATSLSVTLLDYGLFRDIEIPPKAITPQDFFTQIMAIANANKPNQLPSYTPLLATPSTPQTSMVTKFTTNGPQLIENNQAKVSLISVISAGNKYQAQFTFTNISNHSVTIYPLRTSMYTSTLGASPEPTIANFVLAPGQSHSFTFTYITLPDPPLSWRYVNSGGSAVKLGSYSP